MEFFQTIMGKRFYESTMPELVEQLKLLTIELKRLNDREEEKKKEEEK